MLIKKVLITGGAGFIGSNIAHQLLEMGYHVNIIDNLLTGRRENIQDIISKIHFIKGDITNLKLLKKITKGIDYILHQAALPSVPRSIRNPLDTHNNNINGTFNVLLAAKINKIKKVVLASSSSIYGNRRQTSGKTTLLKREIMKAMPLSPYATTKLVGENYAKVFAHIYRLPTICLRYFNVFGPRQDPNSEYAAVIPRFINAILNDERPVIYGNGKQTRDFTYIENVVQANILAMNNQKVREGETINIACGQATSLLELVRSINKVLKKNIKPIFQEAREGEIKHSWADIAKAKRLLNYSPLVNFDDGLKRTITWFNYNK